MRAHYLQHVPFEGLGSIEAWLHAAGYSIGRTAFYAATRLPRLEEVDLLIVMGGPMSVNDEQDHPWLAEEKAFIRTVIQSGRSTLGVCLGAQLIVSALGGGVFPNGVKEIGWFPVRAVHALPQTVFPFPESIEAFHWHGETFDLPVGAVRLAASDACANQAFQIGQTVIGLQFHLETTPASARDLVANCRGELVTGAYVQTAEDILSAPAARYRSINALMGEVLGYLHQRKG